MKSSVFLLVFALSCTWNAAGTTGCRRAAPARALPEELRETSGVAWSRVRSDLLFTHNDGGHDPTVYVFDDRGAPQGRIPLEGAENRDWEDMATGSCPSGWCIYLADVGDNLEVRDTVFLYRVKDQGSYDGSPSQAEVFPMVLPDGPRDMESMFVLPGEDVYFITKGRNHPVTLYRYPPPLRPGEAKVLQAIQIMTDGPLPTYGQITGADASPDGRFVAIRSYAELRFHTWSGGRLVPLEGARVFLRTLGEIQGEGVALGPEGTLVLTSEGALGREAVMNLLECRDSLHDEDP